MTSVSTDRRQGVNAGAAFKVPVRAATTANITLSGEQTIDGVACVTDDRVLVKNQTNTTENGIYDVDTGSWTRAVDCDGTYDLKNGSLVEVNSGTVSARLVYVCTTSDPITIDTSNIAFAVMAPSSPISLPLSLAQGGTSGTSGVTGLAGLGVVLCTAVGGTANAITCTVDSTVTAYRTGQIFELTPVSTNTLATTFTPTPSGAGALAGKNIFVNGAALVGGELVANVPVLLLYDGTQLNIIGRGFSNETEDINPDKAADFTWTYDTSAKLYKKVLLQNASPLPRMAISGLTYSNNAGDVVNDLDIAVGSARDASDAANMFLTSALTKQSDAAWAVGTGAGALDTGAVGNSDYYIWLIKRVDTGVVDVLYSLSSTAPTMPANYTLKRLIGWFKRVGGTIVLFDTYETEGGGIEMKWRAPTQDVALTNTLTTTRRTDAAKTPQNFSTIAILNVFITDAVANALANICCPDETDVAVTAPFANIRSSAAAPQTQGQLYIRTSAAGLIAARSDVATVDTYSVTTLGFRWARRN